MSGMVHRLSPSVADGISFIARLKGSESSTLETQHFWRNLIIFFHNCNSRNLKWRPQQVLLLREAVHLDFLKKHWHSQTQSSEQSPCQVWWNGKWLLSLLSLSDDLWDNHGAKFLMTDRLNQDCLENLLSDKRYCRLYGNEGIFKGEGLM